MPTCARTRTLTSVRARARTRTHRFARRLLFRDAGRAWTQWCDLVDEMHRVRAFGYRFLNHMLVAAFNTWIDARIAQRRLMRTMRRLTRANYARAWASWADFAEEAIAAARKLTRALKGWTNGDLGRAFRLWVGVAARQSDQMDMLRRVYLRMANLKKVARAGV